MSVRICTDKQAKRAVELREVKELLARREIARKAKIRKDRRVPKAYQYPTWKEQLKQRARKGE